ncbi:MAG: cobalamin biosynthesis protein CobD [Silicimonas sp.]|nr:cobalamin biosynthesis protein CobD [Silicimonas sp.]
MLLGLLIEAAMGWPAKLHARISHPVVWIGALISLCERTVNDGTTSTRRAMGSATIVVTLAASIGLAAFVASLLPGGWIGTLLTGLLAWPFIAARSLHEHVAAVALPQEAGDLTCARKAVSMIVGRTPETLDNEAINRAALESLAENASDGVVAPIFWGVIFGLPGIVGYKALNTADSMIGHRTERFEDFGWAAARLDDLANLIPARLTALLIALATGRFARVVSTIRRDARKHRSPNAGWPETAMAAGLGVRLSGPRFYDGLPTDDPFLNADAPDPLPADLTLGLRLYRRTMIIFAASLVAMSLLFG